MALYTERVQTVLSRDQFEMLLQISKETNKSLSVLIREAIEKAYLQEAEQERRRAALQEILALQAPVADWEQMEDEIIRGARRRR